MGSPRLSTRFLVENSSGKWNLKVIGTTTREKEDYLRSIIYSILRLSARLTQWMVKYGHNSLREKLLCG